MISKVKRNSEELMGRPVPWSRALGNLHTRRGLKSEAGANNGRLRDVCRAWLFAASVSPPTAYEVFQGQIRDPVMHACPAPLPRGRGYLL